MIKLFISNYFDIYTNIAIEKDLFDNYQDDIVVFLWRNNPCVVFGRNQNVYSEINIKYANTHNISLARRFSGGGAVYQDLGNLNYTFYCKNNDDIALINNYLIEIFKDLGLDVYFSGRNDLLINDKKFSGIAYCQEENKIMYHGTCLINCDLDQLNKVLKPHDYKLKSHSVASYQSRVTNLADIKDISVDDVINSFIKVLKTKDTVSVVNEIKLNDEINETISLLNSDYIYNDCPSYTYQFDMKLNNANYNFEVLYEDGKINDIKVYSDDLDINKKDYYIKNVLHKSIRLDELKDLLKTL